MVTGAVVCLAVLVVGGGCTAPSVEVEAPRAADGPEECAALLSALPGTVDGQDRRTVTPDRTLAAAWGDPAIVLRCGVAEPAALEPSSPCAEVDGVGWFAQQRASAYRFTTIGRSTFVSVEVPYDYQPAADVLVDVAAAVEQSVPQTRPCV